jgi:hypothetical protein
VLVALPLPLLNWLGRRRDVALARAINCSGIVRDPVPAEHGGAGSVILTLGRRVVEARAVTGGPEIPAGAPVLIRAVVDATTVEVVAEVDFDQIWSQAKPK